MLAVVLVSGLAACKGQSSAPDHERIRRSRDAGAAVAMIDQPGATSAVALPAEREPNDDAASAAPLGAGARGTLASATDVDMFALEVAAPGMVAVRVSPVAAIDLVLELRDPRGQLVVSADRGPPGAGEVMPNAPVTKGSYRVIVREVTRKTTVPKAPKGTPGTPAASAPPARATPSAPYDLTATLLPPAPAGGELEPNGDDGTANDLAIGEPVTGWIGWGGDVDTWKLAIEALAPGNGLDVALTAVDGTALALVVADAAGRTLMKATGVAGEPVALVSLVPRLAEGEAAVHYVRVSGKPSGPELPYTLTVAPRLLDLDEEAEPNDRTASANSLRFGAEDQGAMRGQAAPGDVDQFSLSPSAFAAGLDLALDAPPGVDLVLAAVTTSGATLGDADRGGPGGAETLAVVVPPGTQVHVRLTAKAGKSVKGGAPYQLRWSLTEQGVPAPAPGGNDDPLPPEE